MAKNPADDIPAPSVQDAPLMHTGATCPTDGTLVTCSGLRSEPYLTGRCPVCKRVVYADSSLVSQMGVHSLGPDLPQALVDTSDEDEEVRDGKATRK